MADLRGGPPQDAGQCLSDRRDGGGNAGETRFAAPANVGTAFAAGRAALRDAGIETAATDARLLLGAATGLNTAALLARPELPLDAQAEARFRAALDRRHAGEPVARILGVKEFWGLPFRLSAATLEPRPDTEILVESALAEIRRTRADGNLQICDLGTGTGAILIALLRELPAARGTAVDLSPDAIATARQNAEALGVADRITFEVTDFREVRVGPFDLVVSNPPYIISGDLAALATEVRDHDPRLALDGGPDGLDSYRAIAAAADRLVRKGGALMLELGFGQADAVRAICAGAGLEVANPVPDLAGTPRVLIARR